MFETGDSCNVPGDGTVRQVARNPAFAQLPRADPQGMLARFDPDFGRT
jgi:hypothetical protein